MCLVVDANAASKMFSQPPHEAAVPATKWLLVDNGRLVIGGLLSRELRRIEYAWRTLAELKRAGRAIDCGALRVEQETTAVESTGLCVSNDAHVIALARISGARVLFSEDRDLHRDFTNPELISSPRGRVYQNASHKRLLKHDSSCRWGKGAAQ